MFGGSTAIPCDSRPRSNALTINTILRLDDDIRLCEMSKSLAPARFFPRRREIRDYRTHFSIVQQQRLDVGRKRTSSRRFVRDVRSGAYSRSFWPTGAYEMQTRRFFLWNYGRYIQQIGDFSCEAPPVSRVVSRGPRGHEEESFIDEIVNTPDRRMFCRPIGRLSVAIGDHPMRLVLLHPRQKETQLGRRTVSLSPTAHLNVALSSRRGPNFSSASRIVRTAGNFPPDYICSIPTGRVVSVSKHPLPPQCPLSCVTVVRRY